MVSLNQGLVNYGMIETIQVSHSVEYHLLAQKCCLHRKSLFFLFNSNVEPVFFTPFFMVSTNALDLLTVEVHESREIVTSTVSFSRKSTASLTFVYSLNFSSPLLSLLNEYRKCDDQITRIHINLLENIMLEIPALSSVLLPKEIWKTVIDYDGESEQFVANVIAIRQQIFTKSLFIWPYAIGLIQMLITFSVVSGLISILVEKRDIISLVLGAILIIVSLLQLGGCWIAYNRNVNDIYLSHLSDLKSKLSQADNKPWELYLPFEKWCNAYCMQNILTVNETQSPTSKKTYSLLFLYITKPIFCVLFGFQLISFSFNSVINNFLQLILFYFWFLFELALVLTIFPLVIGVSCVDKLQCNRFDITASILSPAGIVFSFFTTNFLLHHQIDILFSIFLSTSGSFISMVLGIYCGAWSCCYRIDSFKPCNSMIICLLFGAIYSTIIIQIMNGVQISLESLFSGNLHWLLFCYLWYVVFQLIIILITNRSSTLMFLKLVLYSMFCGSIIGMDSFPY